MKKFVISLSAALLCSSVYAVKFHHNKSLQNVSPKIEAKLVMTAEDFSGTWSGQCNNESGKLTITQDDKLFSIEFNDEESGEAEKYDFPIGKVVSNNEASPSDSTVTVRYASIEFNSVSLVSYDFMRSTHQNGGLLATDTLFLSMTKEGNTLKIFDTESSEPCVLTKQ